MKCEYGCPDGNHGQDWWVCYGLRPNIEGLDFRMTVLEDQMGNVRARLDGHDLAFATMTLDEAGKKNLARMQRLGRTMDPEQEGTSRS